MYRPSYYHRASERRLLLRCRMVQLKAVPSMAEKNIINDLSKAYNFCHIKDHKSLNIVKKEPVKIV